MIGLSNLLAPLAFLAAGVGIGDFLPTLRSRPLAPRIAISYLLGLTAVGGGLYAGSHLFGLSLRRRNVLVLILLPIATAILRRALASRPPTPPRWKLLGPPVLVSCAALIGAFVSLAVLGEAATNPMADWDGRMIWGAHARYIAAARSVDPDVFRESRWIVVHPQYPALLPVLQAASMELLDTEDERASRTLYAAFLPALLVIVYDAVRRSGGRRVAAAFAIVTATTPMFALDNHGGAAGSYADLPLACFAGTGFLFLLGARRSASAGLVAGLFLAAAVLTKNEGTPMAVIALATAALRPFCSGRSGRTPTPWRLYGRPLATAAIVTMAAILFVQHWKLGIPNRIDEAYVSSFRLEALIHGMTERAGLLIPFMAQQMADRATWGYFWAAVPILLLAGFPALRRGVVLLLAVFVVSNLCVYAAAYCVTPYDLTRIVGATWNRFLVQVALPLLALLGACAGVAIRGRRPPRRSSEVASEADSLPDRLAQRLGSVV
jgi:Dolichyl-phosphate-mannose-protein mannosyltransferase